MNFRKEFVVEPGAKVHLSKINPSHMGKYESHEQAAPDIAKNIQRMDKLQYLLYADESQSLLVVLQALDAAGKDGTVRHVFSGMNPQGTCVFGFKQPSGARMPPSHVFIFEPLNGVTPPSRKVKTSAPLSVVKATMVFSSSPMSFRSHDCSCSCRTHDISSNQMMTTESTRA